MTIDKTFDPAAIEAKWYKHWESTGAFRPERPDAEPFTIVNPPPNVTGSLHIGHALDNTLQDILIRHARLQGKDALWVVGTDHAGIATQMVVERQLEAQQDKRTNYSREQFVEKVWQWKAESGGQITQQLRRLGCSMDWEREQFTMDPHFSQAVNKVFVDLYNQGLLYRDKRLVNWDPKLKTAISDLEVETTDVKGGFWHFRYPLADGVTLDDGSDHIVVATTRPETMLADMAVAVHPDDPRYKSVIGKDIVQPITGRRFKVVADEHADPELGSGAVKITPGHDFNDFEVGKRAGIKPADMLNMFDAEANVVQTADRLIPAEFIGLHRFKRDGVEGARELVVAQMKELGFLVPHIDKDGNEHDAEPRTIATPFGDRGGVVIEPWLTDQWYVDAATLAKPAIEAARKGAANGGFDIVPKSWEKTYFNWMENIQPWCVSRQLWWGHRIPAWFDEAGNVFVAETEAEAQALVGEGVILKQDEDVLDTWFSSALWPFATLGWPEESPSPSGEGLGVGAVNDSATPTDPTPTPPLKWRGLLDRHYPNDVLISGFDILFFWDARMAMQGIHFMKEVPWKTLYLHGLVRAADGSKMSKSKGNTVDPLGLIDQYGADALRFFMAAMESQGRDIKMDEARVAGYRNFATKLWNAARFAQSNGITASQSIAAPRCELAVNRWIIGEVVETLDKLNKAFEELRFDGMADAIYHFVWDRFCDWYLELIKPVLNPPPQGEDFGAAETRAVSGWVLDQILVMLHPFMPFITEELWHALGERPYDLIHARWPEPEAAGDAEARAEIDWLIRLTSEIRTAKAELGIAPGAKLTATVRDASPVTLARIERNRATLDRVTRLSEITPDEPPAGGAAQLIIDEATFILPLEGVIDLDAERTRIAKAIEAAVKERDALAARLNNAAFVERAKPEAVEKARADHAEKAAEADRLHAALARLG
jgi:valyl-tRNA synthetase